MTTPLPSWLTVDGIAVPAGIVAEGAQAVEQYVLEEQARAAAIDDVTAPETSSRKSIPTDAEGAES